MRDGTRVSGGTINFMGTELTTASEGQKRKLWGAKIAYVAQSAAASFNPAHKIIDQHTEAPIHHNLFSESLLSVKISKRIGYKKFQLIDERNVDGDFIESEAFAFLAIRSFLNLPISFPNTTGCKEPCTGGVMVKNY